MNEVKSEDIQVLVADESHEVYVDTIIDTIREAARKRGTGIAERTHEYVATKMREGKAVLALHGERFVGFSYIETWGNKHYVTTSGLIVHPDYQGLGIAKGLHVHAGPSALAERQNLQSDERRCRDENEYCAGIRAR